MKYLVGRRQRFRRGWLASLLKCCLLHGIGWNCGRRLGLSPSEDLWCRREAGETAAVAARWRELAIKRDFADETVARFQLQAGIREFLEILLRQFSARKFPGGTSMKRKTPCALLLFRVFDPSPGFAGSRLRRCTGLRSRRAPRLVPHLSSGALCPGKRCCLPDCWARARSLPWRRRRRIKTCRGAGARLLRQVRAHNQQSR